MTALSNIVLSSPALYVSGMISAYVHSLSPHSPPLSLFPLIHTPVSAVPSAAPLSFSLIFHTGISLSILYDTLYRVSYDFHVDIMPYTAFHG
jgi:hypothetical protein